MSTSLYGIDQAANWKDVAQWGNSGAGQSGALLPLCDGAGNATALAANSTDVSITGTLLVSSAIGVTSGGTGIVSTTPYAVLCGGTTGTGALQQVSGLGTVGQVLTSTGAGALPTFQTLSVPVTSLVAGNGIAVVDTSGAWTVSVNEGYANVWTIGQTFNAGLTVGASGLLSFGTGPVFTWGITGPSGNKSLTFSQLIGSSLGTVILNGAGVSANSFTIFGASSGSLTLSVAAAQMLTSIQLPTVDGSNGQFLQTNGSSVWSFANVALASNVTGTLPVANGGTGTATTFATGYVILAGASGVYTTSGSTNVLYWNSTTHRLGVGNAIGNSPQYTLHVQCAEQQYAAGILNTAGTGVQSGLLLLGGSNTSDYALDIYAAAGSGSPYFAVRGDGAFLLAHTTGTTGQCLTANSAGIPTWSSFLPLAGGTLTGNLLFTDNTYSIGASGATRPKNLYLSGDITLPISTGSTVGVLYKGANPWLHDYDGAGGGTNTFTGLLAGNFTLSGVDNVGSGRIALNSLTSGTQNVALGVESLYFLTTGNSNVGVGWGSGYGSGLTSLSNCTFLGFGANSSTNGIINSTALGSGAQVTASNQMMFGNSSVTQILFRATGALTLGYASSNAVSGNAPALTIGSLSSSGANGNGGNIVLQPGAANGSGTAGCVTVNRQSNFFGNLGLGLEVNASGTYGGAALFCWSSSATQTPLLYFCNSQSNTIGSQVLTTNGKYLGNLVFAGSDGVQFQEAASIFSTSVGTSSANHVPGDMTFYTSSPTSSRQLALYLSNVQNVGIGTASQFASGAGVLGLANAGTNPSSTPTGGGVLYSNGGALYWMGSSGTLTEIAPA